MGVRVSTCSEQEKGGKEGKGKSKKRKRKRKRRGL